MRQKQNTKMFRNQQNDDHKKIAGKELTGRVRTEETRGMCGIQNINYLP